MLACIDAKREILQRDAFTANYRNIFQFQQRRHALVYRQRCSARIQRCIRQEYAGFHPYIQNFAHQAPKIRWTVGLLKVRRVCQIRGAFIAVARITAGENDVQFRKALKEKFRRYRSAIRGITTSSTAMCGEIFSHNRNASSPPAAHSTR
jgi:hypothetical protein